MLIIERFVLKNIPVTFFCQCILYGFNELSATHKPHSRQPVDSIDVNRSLPRNFNTSFQAGPEMAGPYMQSVAYFADYSNYSAYHVAELEREQNAFRGGRGSAAHVRHTRRYPAPPNFGYLYLCAPCHARRLLCTTKDRG